jgi:hypothetical protein
VTPTGAAALLHALRYPDRSMVIDLSCLEHTARATGDGHAALRR